MDRIGLEDHEDPTEFGAWLRLELRSRRMSQRQLAERSGVDHSTICRILAHRHVPSLGTAVRLARSLGAADLPIGRHVVDDLSPIRRVEHALRGDPAMSEAAVVRTMAVYIRERAAPSSQRSPTPGVWARRGPIASRPR